MAKIPKIIHYVWVGDNIKPDKVNNCINTFLLFNPDYQLKEWSEKDPLLASNTYIQAAIKAKNWALVSDVARLLVLKTYGGIYLDVDVEVLKSFDSLLEYDFFVGYENQLWVNAAIMGSVAQHPIIIEALKRFAFEPKFNFSTNTLAVHNISYSIFKVTKAKLNGKTVVLDNNIALFAKDYFFPQDYMTFKTNITPNSHTIHHYASTWHNFSQATSYKFAKFHRKILGRHIFKLFERIAAKGFRSKLKREERKERKKLKHE